MKAFLILSLLFLTACPQSGGSGGSSGGSSGSDPTATTPTVAVPDSSNVTPPTDPVVVTPPADPTPPPVVPDLSCYSSAGVFCTGGNVYPSTIQLDMDAMFTGGNPGETITSTSVANNVVAYSGGLCTQPSGYQAGCAGGHVPSCLCHATSSCVAVTIHVTGGNFNVTKCGNTVSNYQLVMQ